MRRVPAFRRPTAPRAGRGQALGSGPQRGPARASQLLAARGRGLGGLRAGGGPIRAMARSTPAPPLADPRHAQRGAVGRPPWGRGDGRRAGSGVAPRTPARGANMRPVKAREQGHSGGQSRPSSLIPLAHGFRSLDSLSEQEAGAQQRPRGRRSMRRARGLLADPSASLTPQPPAGTQIAPRHHHVSGPAGPQMSRLELVRTEPRGAAGAGPPGSEGDAALTSDCCRRCPEPGSLGCRAPRHPKTPASPSRGGAHPYPKSGAVPHGTQLQPTSSQPAVREAGSQPGPAWGCPLSREGPPRVDERPRDV